MQNINQQGQLKNVEELRKGLLNELYRNDEDTFHVYKTLSTCQVLVDLSPININELYEYTLKIFGDVFESIIGAVFIDSGSLEKTS